MTSAWSLVILTEAKRSRSIARNCQTALQRDSSTSLGMSDGGHL